MVIVFLLRSCKIRPPPTQSHLREGTCFFRGFNSASSHFSKTSAWYPAKVYPLTKYLTWSPFLTFMRTYLKRPVSMSTGGKDSMDMMLVARIRERERRRRRQTADTLSWIHLPSFRVREAGARLKFDKITSFTGKNVASAADPIEIILCAKNFAEGYYVPISNRSAPGFLRLFSLWSNHNDWLICTSDC